MAAVFVVSGTGFAGVEATNAEAETNVVTATIDSASTAIDVATVKTICAEAEIDNATTTIDSASTTIDVATTETTSTEAEIDNATAAIISAEASVDCVTGKVDRSLGMTQFCAASVWFKSQSETFSKQARAGSWIKNLTAPAMIVSMRR
jgi:ribosome-interacting GTPase 1